MRLVALTLAAACAFAAEPELRVSEGEAKKAAIERPAPAYPMMARQLKVKGQVTLDVIISETGSVAETKILAGNPILTKPAVEAVAKWRFKPFQKQGKPVPAIVTLSFEFDTH